jgi:hypothetical protein
MEAATGCITVKRTVMFFVNLFIKRIWSGVKAVPEEATTFSIQID